MWSVVTSKVLHTQNSYICLSFILWTGIVLNPLCALSYLIHNNTWNVCICLSILQVGNWNQETFYSCLRLHTMAFMQQLGHKNTIWTQPLATLNSQFSSPMSANIYVTLLLWAHPLDLQASRIFSFMRTSILDTGSRRRRGVGGVKGKGGYWMKAWICLTDSFHKAAFWLIW